MDTHEQKLDVERKRLLWRAMHRGIKEMDLIVGGFALARLESMSASELVEFAQILELPDQDLLAWVTLQEPVPQSLTSPFLRELISFKPDIIK
jgi:antitoxin CptB